MTYDVVWVDIENNAALQLSIHLLSVDKKWYLLSNGSDTSTCGCNGSNACKTLDWLLDRFHNTSYTKNHTLSLVTDMNLTMDNNLMVSLIFHEFMDLFICMLRYVN